MDATDNEMPENDPDALVFSVPRFTWYEKELEQVMTITGENGLLETDQVASVIANSNGLTVMTLQILRNEANTLAMNIDSQDLEEMNYYGSAASRGVDTDSLPRFVKIIRFRDLQGVKRLVYIRSRRDRQREAAIVPDVRPEILEALRVV